MISVKPNASQPNVYDLQSCVLISHRAAKLPAAALLDEFANTLARDRSTTVDLLIQMGEIEARKLYVSKACASMYAYCTEHLHMCEGTACRRIRAARVARRLPFILPMLADGTLHLSAASLLAPHLTPQNAHALLAEVTHMSKAQVEQLVARRFPKPDVATTIRPLADVITAASLTAQVVANMSQSPPPVAVVPMFLSESSNVMEPLPMVQVPRSLHQAISQVVAAAAGNGIEACVPNSMLASITDAVTQKIVNAAASIAPESALPDASHAKVTPRSAGRFAWQLTADQEMQDLLEQAQQLIGHAGARDLQAVLKRGLQVLVDTLRKTRFAETAHPRAQHGPANGRHVPAAVARAVAARDGHQCTFVSADGRRCSERMNLEFDHVTPFALGGRTTVENLRLLCSVHNQHEAERVYGKAHMREQRAAARARAEQANTARAEADARAPGKRVSAQQPTEGRELGVPSQGAP